MKKILFLAIILCLISPGFSYAQDWSPAERNKQEFNAYLYCLWFFSKETKMYPFFAIIDSSLPIGKGGLRDFDWKTVDRIERETGIRLDTFIIDDFIQRNRESYIFRKSSRENIVLVEPGQAAPLLAGSSYHWGAFYAVYPKAAGLIEMSRVGFNWDGTMALLYIAMHKEYHREEGYYIIIEKMDQERWALKAMVRAWP